MQAPELNKKGIWHPVSPWVLQVKMSSTKGGQHLVSMTEKLVRITTRMYVSVATKSSISRARDKVLGVELFVLHDETLVQSWYHKKNSRYEH